MQSPMKNYVQLQCKHISLIVEHELSILTGIHRISQHYEMYPIDSIPTLFEKDVTSYPKYQYIMYMINQITCIKYDTKNIAKI